MPSAPARSDDDARALHDLCRDTGLPGGYVLHLVRTHGIDAVRAIYQREEVSR